MILWEIEKYKKLSLSIIRLFTFRYCLWVTVVWSKLTFRPKKEVRTDKIDQKWDAIFFVVQSQDLNQKIIDLWCKILDSGLYRLKIDQGQNFTPEKSIFLY